MPSESEVVAEECQSQAGFLTRVCFCSADSQEEAGIHQEQVFPQEGQETDQEIFIGRPPPTEAHYGWEGGMILNTKLFNKNMQQQENPPIKMNKEHLRFARPLSSRASSPGGPGWKRYHRLEECIEPQLTFDLINGVKEAENGRCLLVGVPPHTGFNLRNCDL